MHKISPLTFHKHLEETMYELVKKKDGKISKTNVTLDKSKRRKEQKRY